MAKKIKDENGNVYVKKKPFYKKIWFWVLVVIVVIGASGALGGGSDSSSSSSSATSAKSSSSSKPKVPAEYTAALKKAESYSSTMNMSKQAIYDQLTSDAGEKFPAKAAQYAVDNVKADWNKNALAKAKSYQKDMSMSTEAIRDQLTSDAGEKFTAEQADYAIQHLND